MIEPVLPTGALLFVFDLPVHLNFPVPVTKKDDR